MRVEATGYEFCVGATVAVVGGAKQGFIQVTN
jgi:hypothetical protein